MLTDQEWQELLYEFGRYFPAAADTRYVALKADRAEMQQRIAALEKADRRHHCALARLDVPCENCGISGTVACPQPEQGASSPAERIAALEAQAQAATLRAERLRAALETAIDALTDAGSNGGHEATCQLMDSRASAPPPNKRVCTCGLWERIKALRAALAAEPDPRPLRQVRQALAELGDWLRCSSEPTCARDRVLNDVDAALALLAELGVGDGC